MKKLSLYLVPLVATTMLITACNDGDNNEPDNAAGGNAPDNAETEENTNNEGNNDPENDVNDENNENEINDDEPDETAGEGYDDGTYRGVFGDGDSYQVGVQFELQDNEFTEVSFRQLEYGGTDFRELEEGDDLYEIKGQYEQAIEYLEGQSVDAIDDLYSPEEMVEDADGFTGATIRSSKVVSALNDALNRGVYSPADGVTRDMDSHDDGTYRGVFADGGSIQVNVQFEIENDEYTDVSFRHLAYGGTDFGELEEGDDMYELKQQYEEAIESLVGQPLDAVYDLHEPGEIVEDVDGFSGATIRSNKVFSAMMDGFNRGVYSPANGVSTDVEDYEDGRYRGIFADGDTIQVGVQFEIENNEFTSMEFRQLMYGGTEFDELEEGDDMYGIKEQYEQAAEYLVGEPIEAMFDLHEPGEFVEDADGFSGATIRANKVLSAIKDGLNRGIY